VASGHTGCLHIASARICENWGMAGRRRDHPGTSRASAGRRTR